MRAEASQRFTAAPSTGEPLAPRTPSGIPAIPGAKQKRCQRFRAGDTDTAPRDAQRDRDKDLCTGAASPPVLGAVRAPQYKERS